MKPLCLECATPLRPEDINPAADVARCPSCGAVFPARQLLRRNKPFDKRRPPKDSGIELRLDADGFGEVVLRAKMEGSARYLAAPFVIIWLVVLGGFASQALKESLAMLLVIVPMACIGTFVLLQVLRPLFEVHTLAFGDEGIDYMARFFSYRSTRRIPYSAVRAVRLKPGRNEMFEPVRLKDFTLMPSGGGDGPNLELADRLEYFGYWLKEEHSRWLAALVRDLVRAHQRRLGIVVQTPAKRRASERPQPGVAVNVPNLRELDIPREAVRAAKGLLPFPLAALTVSGGVLLLVAALATWAFTQSPLSLLGYHDTELRLRNNTDAPVEVVLVGAHRGSGNRGVLPTYQRGEEDPLNPVLRVAPGEDGAINFGDWWRRWEGIAVREQDGAVSFRKSHIPRQPGAMITNSLARIDWPAPFSEPATEDIEGLVARADAGSLWRRESVAVWILAAAGLVVTGAGSLAWPRAKRLWQEYHETPASPGTWKTLRLDERGFHADS